MQVFISGICCHINTLQNLVQQSFTSSQVWGSAVWSAVSSFLNWTHGFMGVYSTQVSFSHRAGVGPWLSEL